jgi:hypothetical protein
MACPSCGCKETYQFNDCDGGETDDEEMQRCAACSDIFPLADEVSEGDDDGGSRAGWENEA